MTPQERAAIYTYHKVFDGYNFLSGPKGMEEIVTHDMELVSLEDHEDALQETRQAALLEAAEIAKECAKERRKEEEKYGEHVKNDPRSIWASCRASEAEVIVAKIDRLAQEG